MAAYAIHISDLHIGSDIRGGGVFPYAPGGIIPKATGHDERALEALANFLITFHEQHEDDVKALIVSGDVSSNGAETELALYKTLLELGFVKDNYVTLAPLKQGFQSVLDLPGNHDLWNGLVVPNPVLNKSVRARFFDQSPWNAELICGGYRIAFHGLCSTSGCTWQQQLLAFGAFAPNDLNDTTAAVQACAAQGSLLTLLQILVMHHSAADRSAVSHSLTPRAHQSLAALYQNHPHLRGMMTGHRHQWLLDTTRGPWTEVRCGTTLQSPLPGCTHDRSLIVHEFVEDGHGLDWWITPWLYGGSQFDPDTRQHVLTC